MPVRHLGQVTITQDIDGELFVRNQWNPQDMPRSIRAKIADELGRIADELAADRFEEDGQFVFHKAPMEGK
jgi:hypothetical protein